MKLLSSEKEKYANDKQLLKEIVEYFETTGERQVWEKERKYTRLHNLATGVMNVEDYIDHKEELDSLLHQSISIEDVGLMFYPVIPNIVDSIVSEYSKRYTEYVVQAVNPEHTNDILTQLSEQLRQELITQIEAQFMSTNPTPEQYDAFSKSEEITKYYTKDYRSTIEQWANHRIQVDKRRLKTELTEKELLRQIIITDTPCVHVNYLDGNYSLDVVDDKEVFYLKSPNVDDFSDSMMVGWFQYSTVSTIMNQYANLLTQRDLERLAAWTNQLTDTDFVVNNVKYTGNRLEFHESAQNLRAFKNLMMGTSRYDEIDVDLVRETHMYFILPRKVGKLTMISDGQTIKEIVSEEYKVTFPPKYDGKKSEENLLSGEHIEWFYINELYRCIKLDVGHKTWKYKEEETDERSIYVFLDKNPIQYPAKGLRYGIRIPVHGGPTTNKYTEIFSPVERAAPNQVMYNWIKNRIQQLIATEVGKFIILNQNLIPQESFDGSWGKNNLLKFFMVAKDTSIAPIDPSISNLGTSNIANGFGQVVDLTKTQEVLEKLNVANAIKLEIFEQFGLTREFILGDYSPEQTASSIAQGMQRSLSQVQKLYDRLDEIMVNVWETVLDTAQYMETQEQTSNISYTEPDGTRVMFKINTDKLLLHKLSLFIRNSAVDQQNLERIKSVIMSSNTLGADTYELGTILTATSIPDLMGNVKKIQEEKQKQAEQKMQQEQQMQREQIQAQQEMLDKKLAEDRERFEMESEKDILIAQIRSLGYANSEVDAIAKEIDNLRKEEMNRAKLDQIKQGRDSMREIKEQSMAQQASQTEQQRLLQEKIKMRELDLKEKEIQARNRRSDAIKK
jgi:hypothetical protein